MAAVVKRRVVPGNIDASYRFFCRVCGVAEIIWTPPPGMPMRAAVALGHAFYRDHRTCYQRDAEMALRASVIGVIEKLPPRERRVIHLRFGLDGNGQRTFRAIGLECGFGAARAHQLYRVAIRKLRHPVYSRLLGKCVGIRV